jgi:hypothetical protein
MLHSTTLLVSRHTLRPPPFFDLESLTPYVEAVVDRMLGQQDRQSSIRTMPPVSHCPISKLAGRLGYLLALMPDVRKLAPSVESCVLPRHLPHKHLTVSSRVSLIECRLISSIR